MITAPDGGDVAFGFMSLMPSDTFMNHGLRKDLVMKLQEMKPLFLRFPGGCIRRLHDGNSHVLQENSRTGMGTPGRFVALPHDQRTGFHEYLQLCEDLNLQALYVCNCGDRQAAGVLFQRQGMEDVIQIRLMP